MGALIIILPVLSLGEFNATRASADNHSNPLPLRRRKGFEIDPGIICGLLCSKKCHWNYPLYAVFVFLRDETVKVKVFDFGSYPARQFRCVKEGYRSRAADPASGCLPECLAPDSIGAHRPDSSNNDPLQLHQVLLFGTGARLWFFVRCR